MKRERSYTKKFFYPMAQKLMANVTREENRRAAMAKADREGEEAALRDNAAAKKSNKKAGTDGSR